MHCTAVFHFSVGLRIFKIKVWGKASLWLETNAWRRIQHNPWNPCLSLGPFREPLITSHTFWEQKKQKDSNLPEDPGLTTGGLRLSSPTTLGPGGAGKPTLSDNSSSPCPGVAISISSKMSSSKSGLRYTEHCVPTGIFQNSKIRLMEVSYKPTCSLESPTGLAEPQIAGPYPPIF